MDGNVVVTLCGQLEREGVIESASFFELRARLAGRYDTILPPTAVSDLMIYAYWSAGARKAGRGLRVGSGATKHSATARR